MTYRRPKIAPRLLSREQMADYIGCSESTIDTLVAEGLLPGPENWRGLVRWDKVSVDLVIDRVYGLIDATADAESIDEAIRGRNREREVRRGSA